MMISQFKRGTDTWGFCFAIGGNGKVIYGKAGEGSGLSTIEEKPHSSQANQGHPT
jgi:hypothetical protein